VRVFSAANEIIFFMPQPLTDFPSKRCKRCGFYEEDNLSSDDIFEEWEFCPSDFSIPDGKYVRIKDKEFNATFLCPECLPFANGECLLTFILEIPFAVFLAIALHLMLRVSLGVFGTFGHFMEIIIPFYVFFFFFLPFLCVTSF